MHDTIAIFLGKLLGSAAVTAVVSAATVYFVVDMSLRGMESSITTTNLRIDDLREDLTSTLDLKFKNLELQLKNEFSETRKEIKKAELETGIKIAGALPNWEPKDFGTFQLLLDPQASSLEAISKADQVVALWAKMVVNKAEAQQMMASGLFIAANESVKGVPEIKWVSKAGGSDELLTEFLKFKDCATISQLQNGDTIIVPVAAKSVVGNDGFLCKPNLDQPN